MEEGWKHVYNFGQEYKAIIAKEMLMEHGITAVLINKKDTAYQSFGDIEVYVQEENVVRAKKLLSDFES